MISNLASYTNGYAMVPRVIIQELSLKPAQKAILDYLISLPKDWMPRPQHIKGVLGMCYNTFNKHVKVLQDLGLLVVYHYRSKRGRFTKNNGYILKDPEDPILSQEQLASYTKSIGIEETPEFSKHQLKILRHRYTKFGYRCEPRKIGTCKNENSHAIGIPTDNQKLGTLLIREKTKKHREKREAEKFFSNQRHSSKKQQEKANKQKQGKFNQILGALNALKSTMTGFKTDGLTDNEAKAFWRFIAYRKGFVKVTHAVKKAILDRFIELKAQGQDLEVCVNRAIAGSYREIKPQKSEFKIQPLYNEKREAIEVRAIGEVEQLSDSDAPTSHGDYIYFD
ncbi:hypothetical protein [Helicobacter ailurogastricus]|uniref:hypothetical protein n=1 Tax=Helicobacter ailurogastricus TaxID=1578720 RepID=UPI000CF1007F|nr:hypothetical protein [Helicobacter ailurogastricus]